VSDADGARPLVAVVVGLATGGTARHAGMIAEGCRRAGLPVLAFGPAAARAAFRAGTDALPAESGQAAAISYSDVEIADRPSPARDLRTVMTLRRLLRRDRPDIVHAHGLRAGAFAALALLGTGRPPGRSDEGQIRRQLPDDPDDRRGASIRLAVGVGPGPGRDPSVDAPRDPRPALVVTVHNAPPPGRAARLIYGALELICARRADAVLCVSPDLAARMRRLGVSEPGLAVVPALDGPPPGADAVARAAAGLRAAAGPESGGAVDQPVVLAVGRLAAQKGYDTLLAAAADWQRRDPVPILAIAGEGPLASELAATAARTGVGLVQLGQRDDVPALLAAADVYVLPSQWEGQPLILQEALRAGRPIVATRVGGIPGMTGEGAAILVPPGDAARLAEAVAAVLDDPGRAAGLAAAARARAATLPTAADAVAAALSVYRRLAVRR
jgi:glycosyltransferase involved in cell wall biosynthesis